MACVDFENGQVPPNLSYKPIENLKDPRIEAAVNFATNRMNGLLPNDPKNKHYPCPILFYSGRETLIDYLNRTNERIVIQSGGWVGKYYPLLAKTAIMMLEDPQKTNKLRADDSSIIGNFINRTRFPITSRVNAVLKSWVEPTTKLLKNTHFKTAIIGAGCSGLYAAYRLNNEKKTSKARSAEIGNIGVFELSDRISGRLKSFKFTNTTTPMELGGMRYIPTNHVLVNEIITDLGIPHLKFSMRGDPIQNAARMAFLRNDYYRMNEWDATQNAGHNLITSYRI